MFHHCLYLYIGFLNIYRSDGIFFQLCYIIVLFFLHSIELKRKKGGTGRESDLGSIQQHFTCCFYLRRSKKRKKTVNSSSFFALLRSVGVKAVCKHVDEIDSNWSHSSLPLPNFFVLQFRLFK